jgi:hypothetical protein
VANPCVGAGKSPPRRRSALGIGHAVTKTRAASIAARARGRVSVPTHRDAPARRHPSARCTSLDPVRRRFRSETPPPWSWESRQPSRRAAPTSNGVNASFTAHSRPLDPNTPGGEGTRQSPQAQRPRARPSASDRSLQSSVLPTVPSRHSERWWLRWPQRQDRHAEPSAVGSATAHGPSVVGIKRVPG